MWLENKGFFLFMLVDQNGWYDNVYIRLNSENGKVQEQQKKKGKRRREMVPRDSDKSCTFEENNMCLRNKVI